MRMSRVTNRMPCRYEDVQAYSSRAVGAGQNRERQTSTWAGYVKTCMQTEGQPKARHPSRNNPSQHQWEYGPSAIPPHTPLQLFSLSRWSRGFGNSHADGVMANFTVIHSMCASVIITLSREGNGFPRRSASLDFTSPRTHAHAWRTHAQLLFTYKLL